MRGRSFMLRVAAVVVFILATVGPVPMTLLGLALWCGGSMLVPWRGGA